MCGGGSAPPNGHSEFTGAAPLDWGAAPRVMRGSPGRSQTFRTSDGGAEKQNKLVVSLDALAPRTYGLKQLFMRKYEIHLPLSYRDGEPIEQEKISRVHKDLAAVFGSFAVPDRGAWRYDGMKCVEIVKIEIITTGDKVPKKRLKDLKERLKEFLQQSDILIMTHGIQGF